MKILVLTQFHKNFLKDLNISKEKIYVYPNFINIPLIIKIGMNLILSTRTKLEEKGIKELINVFHLGNLN